MLSVSNRCNVLAALLLEHFDDISRGERREAGTLQPVWTAQSLIIRNEVLRARMEECVLSGIKRKGGGISQMGPHSQTISIPYKSLL